MKTLQGVSVLFLTLFFLVACTSQQEINEEGENEQVKPKIKSSKIYSYKLDAESDLEEGVLMEEFEYDRTGRETKLVRYDTTGKVLCTFNYKYDQSGNLTEKIWSEASGKREEHTRSTTLRYDLDGATSKKEGQNNKNVKYDRSGKLIERIWSDKMKGAEIKETHHYFKDHKEREVVHYMEDNKIEKRTIHTYDTLGNEIATITYAEDSTLESKITYVYDEYGNIKEDIYWNVRDSVPEQIIKYVYEFY